MTEQITPHIELRMNELAQGPLFAASTREQYVSGDLCVTFTTTAREGATADMLNETKRHFLETAKAVYELRSFASTDEQWSKRSDWNPVQAPHGEPRVNIFGDMLVKVDDKHVSVSVNKFTEYTTAFEMARHLYMVAECVRLPIGGQPKPTVSTAAARQALGAGDQRRVSAPASAPAPDAQSDSGTPHFESFRNVAGDATKRAQFGADYGGKVVSFTATKIERAGSKKLDADGLPQLEWGFYELPNYQHPFTESTLEFIREDATKAYLAALPKSIEGEWRVVCYVNVKNTGKVYFNVNKVEPIGDTPDTPWNADDGDVDLRDVFPNDPFAEDADLSANVPPVDAADEIPF